MAYLSAAVFRFDWGHLLDCLQRKFQPTTSEGAVSYAAATQWAFRLAVARGMLAVLTTGAANKYGIFFNYGSLYCRACFFPYARCERGKSILNIVKDHLANSKVVDP